jgi:hypothetical protein
LFTGLRKDKESTGQNSSSFLEPIRLYTKFELLMSITFFRNPLFEMKKVMAVYRSCARRAGSQAFVRNALQPAKGTTPQAGRNQA